MRAGEALPPTCDPSPAPQQGNCGATSPARGEAWEWLDSFDIPGIHRLQAGGISILTHSAPVGYVPTREPAESSLRLPTLDPVFFHLIAQGSLTDPQALGGLRLVSPVCL